jgi:hypothetical protein
MAWPTCRPSLTENASDDQGAAGRRNGARWPLARRRGVGEKQRENARGFPCWERCDHTGTTPLWDGAPPPTEAIVSAKGSTSRTRSGSSLRHTRLARDASRSSCISAVSSSPMALATPRVRPAPDATPPPTASPAADAHRPTTGARWCRLLGGRLTALRRCRLRAAAWACRPRPPSAAPGRRTG